MSSSKSSSSTRRNAARWISPSTNRNIFSGIPDKISRSRCSSAEIRSCRVIFFFLGTKSPLSRDSRVVHARAASKKKGPPPGPSRQHPLTRQGGLCRPATALRNWLNKATQTRVTLVLFRVALPAQQLQVVWVVCDVPIFPVLVIQRNNVVYVNASLNTPLAKALLA